MHNQPGAPKMTSTTTALLQNLATLRATRDAILAELESISARQAADTGDVAPCNVCGNDFADTNCSCELPPTAAYDW